MGTVVGSSIGFLIVDGLVHVALVDIPVGGYGGFSSTGVGVGAAVGSGVDVVGRDGQEGGCFIDTDVEFGYGRALVSII